MCLAQHVHSPIFLIHGSVIKFAVFYLFRNVEGTGARPPPIGDFTFNKIDKTRALLYGGRIEKTTFSSVYILDCELLVSGLLSLQK